MSKSDKGFTLIEVMIGAILLAMVIGAIFKLTSSGQKTAMQVMQSHQVNEEIQAAVDRFEDDVKEANILLNSGEEPPSLDLNGQPLEQALAAAIQAQTLKTDDPKNLMKLIKYTIVSPNDAGTNVSEGCVKKYYVEYFFDEVDTNVKALIRKFGEIQAGWDGTGAPTLVDTSVKIKPVISEIDCTRDYCLFFRVVNSDGAISARNVFLTADLKRKDKKDKTLATKEVYHATVLVSGHFRGSAHN